MSNDVIISMTGFATYLPEGRMSAAEIAERSGVPEWVVREKMGITQKTVPGPQDHPAQMGVRAARKALQRAGLQAADVDVVISITEEYKEYPVWTAGIKLAHDLGAVNAWAYDIGQKCGTAVLALKQARDLLVADPDVNTVLIAGGYRNGDLISFDDPNVRFMYNLGAGAAAAVLQRRQTGNNARGARVLSSHIITDGSFSLDVLVPVGGTVEPLTANNTDRYRLTVPDPPGMKARLEEKSLDNFISAVKRAVAKSGRELADIDYLAMLHVKRSAHDYVLAQLGVPAGKSIYLSDYGHLGQVDQLLSLELAQQQGQLRNGDFVVLVAAGVGYVWNAICLEWGDFPGFMPAGAP